MALFYDNLFFQKLSLVSSPQKRWRGGDTVSKQAQERAMVSDYTSASSSFFPLSLAKSGTNFGQSPELTDLLPTHLPLLLFPPPDLLPLFSSSISRRKPRTQAKKWDFCLFFSPLCMCLPKTSLLLIQTLYWERNGGRT